MPSCLTASKSADTCLPQKGRTTYNTSDAAGFNIAVKFYLHGQEAKPLPVKEQTEDNERQGDICSQYAQGGNADKVAEEGLAHCKPCTEDDGGQKESAAAYILVFVPL